MAKKRDMIVAGQDCKDCKHCDLKDSNVYCFAKNKRYMYGQYVPCDLKEKKSDNKE